MIPSRVRPHGAPGSRPGPHSMYQPASRRTSGNRNRAAPKYGTVRFRHQSVSDPPGSASAISDTAPSISSTIPTRDRRTAGDSPSDSDGRGSAPPRLGAARDGRREPVEARVPGEERGVDRRRGAIR